MKKIITLILLITFRLGFSQSQNNLTIFHRLLVYNNDAEIMMVKIKSTDVWVTPGFYQDSTQFVKKGLHDVAATYGMSISEPELKGIFSMRRENKETQKMLIRNLYTCNYLGGEIHFPEGQSFEIGEIKWLAIDEALAIIPFESMRMFVKQVHDFPEMVSGGSIHATRKDNRWENEIIEEFYPLYTRK